MNVYVATRFDNYTAAVLAHDQLLAEDHTPTSARWVSVARELKGDCAGVPIGDDRRLSEAQKDLDDIDRADALILLVPEQGGCGMWVELGYALARGKQVLCVGPALSRSIFCELVECYETVEQALEAIST